MSSTFGIIGEAGSSFQEQERVFAFHKSMLYNAKILKVEMRANPDSTRLGDRVPYYLIHYHGWADRFDEWVDESRILKYTEENQKIQESMLRESQARKKKAVAAAAAAAGGAAAASGAAGAAGSGAAGTTVAGASGFAASGKKSKKDRRAADASSSSGGAAYGSGGSSSAAGAGAAAMQAAVLADLPPALRRSLLDEYDLVTVKKFLLPLPHKYPVVAILRLYREFKQSQKPRERTFAYLPEVVEGLQLYFDKALACLLLYRFERPQFMQLMQRFESPSAVYGANHLLRLFVKLPELFVEVAMEPASQAAIVQHVNDIVQFIHLHMATFLGSVAYEPASPQYVRLVE